MLGTTTPGVPCASRMSGCPRPVINPSRDRPLTDRAGRVAGQRTTRPHTVVITTGAWSLVPTSASTTQALARAATVGDASM